MHGYSQAHMQQAPHARMARTHASNTTHISGHAQVAWSPALRHHFPPPCLSKCPEGPRADQSSFNRRLCYPHTRADTRVGHAGGRSGRHDPLVATSHHACLSKCLLCHARGKGRLIQFQTINRSAIASSPFVQVLIISAGQVIKAWSGAAVNKCEANMKPASKVGPSRRAAIP